MKNTIGKEDFFREISALANYCDLKLVENVYYGMVKVMSRQLKLGREVKLPDWGNFYINKAAPRQGIDVHTGKIRNLGMKKCLKFRPAVKVKAYFRDLE